MAEIAIIGGGISGLALAYRLEQRLPDASIRVLERAERVGGTIGTIHRDGFRLEAGPNGFLDNNPATLQLCRDLRIHDQLIAASEAARKNRYLLLDGRLRRLPSGLVSFLTSSVLGWRAKTGLLYERFRRSPVPGSDESIDAFARRRAGDEVADVLVDAFVTGIFAGDPTLLSVQACLPRLAAYERAHGSVQRGLAAARRQRRADAAMRGEPRPGRTRMWSFREGLGFLVQALQKRLRQAPATGVAVRAVRRDGSRWLIEGTEQEWGADAVALTCPAHQQVLLLAGLDAGLAQEIAAIPYNRVAVVGLGFQRSVVPVPLDGFGYLSRQCEGREVLGVQWCSSIFPDRAPPGTVLLRAMCGGWRRPELVDWEPARLVDTVRAELAAVLGIRGTPVFQHVVRWDRAIPQYHLGHLDRVARIETLAAAHAGLYLGGNSYRGVALNDCVEQAGLLAERVAAALTGPGPAAARSSQSGMVG
jgi:oxygen-dependent protoporphyrinogen oxidase